MEEAGREGSSAPGDHMSANYEAQKSGKTKPKPSSNYPQILQTNQPIIQLIIKFYPLYKLQNVDIRGQPPVSMDANA